MFKLIFINPFLALLLALRDMRSPSSKNVVWFFVFFVGLTWAIRPGTYPDSVRYVEKLKLFYKYDIGFIEYYLSGNDIDFFSTGLTYLISRFTDYGPALIIAQSIIFGYFFSRNMAIVMQNCEGRLKTITLILFLSFFMVMPIWSFNGFRFNLATHIFIYGLLNYFFLGRKNYLLWCFLTPFVFHYAFLAMVAVLCVYLVAGDRVRVYFGVFIFSLFFAEFDFAQFNQMFEKYIPKSFQEKSESYLNEGYVSAHQAKNTESLFEGKRSWHAKLYKKSVFWSLSALLIYFYLRRGKLILLQPKFLSTLSFSLLSFAFANFMMNVPSGGRYASVTNLFALSFMVMYVQNIDFDKWGQRLTKMVSPILLFFVIVSVREGFFYLSLTTIIGNPIIALFSIGENINLDLLLKP